MLAKNKKVNDSSSSASAALHRSQANPKEEIKNRLSEVSAALAPQGLSFFPNQDEAIPWALKKLSIRRAIYLGVDPGLGKTIMAAAILNHFKGYTGFYVCPPFLTTNTDEEFTKWCFEKKLVLIADTMMIKEHVFNDLEKLVANNPKRILYVDEAHRFKEETSQRTLILLKKILPYFEHVVFMSGTPLPNARPKELWPILKHAAPDLFGTNFFEFGLKFCGGHKKPFGWDFNGFTNKDIFKKILFRDFMLRQKKDKAMLPEKVRGLLTVGEGIPPIISGIEKKILEHYSQEDLTKGKIIKLLKVDDLHLATYAKELGKYKLKFVLPLIHQILEDNKDEKLILFGIHKDVIAGLRKDLSDYDPIVINGEVPVGERQDLVKEFQGNKERRVFIGNIQACGTGFTLTKATRVLFIEFDWVDGNNEQAEDRVHRIGLEHSVLIQYVVLKDSFDRTRMEVVLNKRKKAL